MGDGETLLLVLSLLYISDCVIWIGNQSVAFFSPWRRRWRIAFGNSFIGNARGSLFVLNPLPPFGRIFLSHLPPVSLSAEGVCNFNPKTLFRLGRGSHSGRAVRFSEISSAMADGVYLLINGLRFAKCATARQAQTLSELINGAIVADEPSRNGLIQDYLRGQFALPEAREILEKVNHLIKPIQFTCMAFFLFLFVVAPVLINVYGLPRLIVPTAFMIIAFAIQITVMFYFAHRELYPKETQERIINALKMVLCPPVSIRATDLLTKNLLSDYSPMVLASVLPGTQSRNFMRAFILDLQHPLAYEATDPLASTIVSTAAAGQLSLSLEHIKCAYPSDVQALLGPPRRNGNSSFYCPRCAEQFLKSAGPCPDCPGVELLPFTESSDAELSEAL
jgi:hypothetical protein